MGISFNELLEWKEKSLFNVSEMSAILELMTEVSGLFTNTPTPWRHNEQEIWIMHEAEGECIIQISSSLCL